MPYVTIKEQEMDKYLKQSKGWVKEACGYEYVYSFRIPSIRNIVIKVMSSINTGDGSKCNKGSHAIRIFAVKTQFDIDSGKHKIVCGYIKKQKVNITENWKTDLLDAYKIVLAQVRVRARRENLL